MEIDPQFESLVEVSDLRNIDASSNTIYAVWPDLRLALENRGWFQFAAENGADADFAERWLIGESIEPVCRGRSGEHFCDAIHKALRDDEVQIITYECSGAATFRLMRGTIFPLGDRAVLLSHSLIRTSTHAGEGRVATSPGPEYVDGDGLIVMCSGCRRTRRADDPSTWDWVPDFVENVPENASHGFCAACKSYWTSPVARPKPF